LFVGREAEIINNLVKLLSYSFHQNKDS
jgi:hypothetical protein